MRVTDTVIASPSMELTATGQKSERASMACETCRKRKRKCDGCFPCVWCSKNHVECVFVTERYRKRRIDHNYVAGLEEQNALLNDYVRRLEAIVGATSRPEHISDLLQDQHIGTDEESGHQASELAEADKTGTMEQQAAIDDVSSIIWNMSISDDGKSSFIGPSGNFCFPFEKPGYLPTSIYNHNPKHQINSTPTASQLILNIPTSADLNAQPNPTGSDSHIINPQPLSLQENPASITALLAFFSTYINSVHRFLDDDTILALKSPMQPDPGMALLRNSVLAAAALYSDDAHIREQGGSIYAAAAETAALRCCQKFPSPEVVQGLAILCWRELGLEHENEAWLYNAMCGSLCVHLGLHISALESVHEGRSSGQRSGQEAGAPQLDQLHYGNRAFWASFAMDRMATSLLGRNCIIPLSRVCVIPVIESFGSQPSTDEIVFHCQCRLWLLHDRWMDKIYSFEFSKIEPSQRLQLLLNARDELQVFYRTLPPEASLKRQTNNQNVMVLHMIYHMSCLSIHRPYLKEASASVARRLAYKTNEVAASMLIMLVKRYPKASISHSALLHGDQPPGQEASWDKAPFLVIHCVLTAAISMLLNATSPTTGQGTRNQSVSKFRACVAALDAMGPRWLRARRALVLLRQLAYRWNIVAALPMRHSFPLNAEGTSVSETCDTAQLRREVSKIEPLAWEEERTGVMSPLLSSTDYTMGTRGQIPVDWTSEFLNLEFFSDLDVGIDLSDQNAAWTPWDYSCHVGIEDVPLKSPSEPSISRLAD